MKNFLQKTLVPLLLMTVCPLSVLIFWHINTQLQGSVLSFYHTLTQNGTWNTIHALWQPVFFGTSPAWKMIFVFMLVQLILMRVVPGKRVTGPETFHGNIPVYKNNGFSCFIITLALFFVCSYPLKLFSPAIVYNHFAGILGALNIFSLYFCLLLYLKGRFKPSSSDHSTSGNIIFDYYWGTELYPRIFGWDVKQFTNCRFGMMSWAIIIISFAAKQAELYGLSDSMVIAVIIMLAHIGKFFWWESGYFRSMDIMHDRAGFYICWGCLVWVPCVYTMPVMYLVNHPIHFSVWVATTIATLGIACVVLSYVADAQRQKVRATHGNCTVWGKSPQLIHAAYVDQHGKQKQSLLLTSGFWGISRHFHYLLEIALSFFWTLPALFVNFLPWFYVIFLTMLLIHRSYRDDKRCANKYGEYWKQYCNQVPNKIIPWVKLFMIFSPAKRDPT